MQKSKTRQSSETENSAFCISDKILHHSYFLSEITEAKQVSSVHQEECNTLVYKVYCNGTAHVLNAFCSCQGI